MDNTSVQPARYCELCDREERCHCPAVKSYCAGCCPPLPVQSDYAKALGEPAPEPVKVFLLGRLSA